jgi:DNA 3'-phosphatase
MFTNFPNEINNTYSKYACFDLDHTLIKPKSNKVFPIDKDDWKFMINVKTRLTLLHDNNWCIIIFTNQSGIGKHTTLDDINEKFNNIRILLNIPIYFIASTSNNFYRKPFIGMWQYIQNEFDIQSDHQIFYSGDACDLSHKKLNCSDLKFALNCNIPFIHPDDLFVNKIDINNLFVHNKIITNTIEHLQNNIFNYVSKKEYDIDIDNLLGFINKYNYIFIISPPSSGKTTLCKNILENHEYIRLSKDDYKSFSLYKKAIVENINNKIVFDNTNYTTKSRELICELLVKHGISTDDIGYIYRNIKKEDSIYLNKYRHYISNGEIKLLPDVAIHTYYKNVELPENHLTISHLIKKNDLIELFF